MFGKIYSRALTFKKYNQSISAKKNNFSTSFKYKYGNLTSQITVILTKNVTFVQKMTFTSDDEI